MFKYKKILPSMKITNFSPYITVQAHAQNHEETRHMACSCSNSIEHPARGHEHPRCKLTLVASLLTLGIVKEASNFECGYLLFMLLDSFQCSFFNLSMLLSYNTTKKPKTKSKTSKLTQKFQVSNK
jgi:hypothetical protein